MNASADIVSNALFQSLVTAAPLLHDLPEASAFASDSLVAPEKITALNFQQKLGHLYEDAMAAMLASTPRYNTLAQGLQIREESGRTLGELDFLIRDLVLNKLIHLELAVKFYLAVETENGFLLPGPDARDNYFRKLEKMRSHQLVLTEKHRGLLPEEIRKEKIVVQQLVHGCVFDHIHSSKLIKTEFMNPAGRRGKWMQADECAEYFGKSAPLEIIPKPLWPAPPETIAGLALESWKPDGQIDRCVMVRADSGNIPYFITPNGYPMMHK